MILSEIDLISKLPGDLAHHILSFLPPEDAPRTMILSKTWLRIWDSLPLYSLVFKDFHLSPPPATGENLLINEFIHFINDTLFMIQRTMSIDNFTLTMSCPNSMYRPVINDWINSCSCKLKRKREGEPESYRSCYYSVTLEIRNFNKFRLLFPRLRILLELSFDIDSMSFSKFDKLLSFFPSHETLTMKIKNAFWSPFELDSPLPAVKHLRLENILFLEVQLHISTNKICISSDSLRELKLEHMGEHQHQQLEIDIKTPDLRKLKYFGRRIPLFHSSLIHLQSIQDYDLCLETSYCNLDPWWFIHLRKSLDKCRKVSVTLDFDGLKEDSNHHLSSCQGVILGNPQEECIVSPPANIHNMELRDIPSWLDTSALLDGLLWSCHPTTLAIKSTYGGVRFLERARSIERIIHQKFIKGEKVPDCCCRGNQAFRYCGHCLKEIDVQISRRPSLMLVAKLFWSP